MTRPSQDARAWPCHDVVSRLYLAGVSHPLPLYAVAVPLFRFRHLATFAGRAPIGGTREVALGCLVVARLAASCDPRVSSDADARLARSHGAKAWLGTLALPIAVRSALARCVDVTGDASCAGVGGEISALATVVTPYLDAASTQELDLLAGTLAPWA